MKPQLKNEVLASIVNHRYEYQDSRSEKKNTPPKNLDELTQLARTMLMEEPLEVSKVRPLFWSMVETHVDRFQVFPFDVTKALFSYLELKDYPADRMQKLITQLQEMYIEKHGESSKQDLPSDRIAKNFAVDDERSDEDSMKDTLLFAAKLAELETD